MSILHAIILGAVQGLTEFFPISSSGHLFLFPWILGWEDQGLVFDTILHAGTFCAVAWYFRRDLFALFYAVFNKQDALKAVQFERASQEPVYTRQEVLRLWGLVALATVPALMIALVVGDVLEQYARHVPFVAFNLIIWGIVLFVADRYGSQQKPHGLLTWKEALLVGCLQSFALLPGSSRSGITIAALLLLGYSRGMSARFSFLLSLPITAAAGAYGFLHVVQDGSLATLAQPWIWAGFLSAVVFGAFAIRTLIAYVSRQTYTVFVLYRIFLAVGLLALWLGRL